MRYAAATALALGVVAAMIGTAVHQVLWMTSGVDLTKPCSAARAKDCVAREPGRVVSTEEGGDDNITVAYRDETRTATVYLSGAHLPSVGTRVVLERWNGKIVSVLERGAERRHQTYDWPSISFDSVFVTVLSLLLAGVAAVIYVRWVVGELRRRRLPTREASMPPAARSAPR